MNLGQKYFGAVIFFTVFLNLVDLFFVFFKKKLRIELFVCGCFFPFRWPNPVHAGAFAGGLLHTIVVYLSELLPCILGWVHRQVPGFSRCLPPCSPSARTGAWFLTVFTTLFA